MALNKVTEILNKTAGNITQRMPQSGLKTEIMPGKAETNVTWVMDEDPAGSAVQIGSGTSVNGYVVEDVLTENTGEATLLLVGKDADQYVLKLYHKNKTPKQELLEKLQEIDSKYVICAVDSGNYHDRFYEVLPFYKEGDLLSNMPISTEIIEKVIVLGLNEGLRALHQKEIIHRDIKPSNVFFDQNKESIVIGDFGISSVLNGDVSVRATSMSRTLGYSAPETSNGFISKESDYYSFGITLLHLVVGTDPFAGMSDMQILYQTINKKIDIPMSAPVRIRQLIQGLTLKDRNYRWGYEEVARWLNGENVFIQEQDTHTEVERPYKFLKEGYYDKNSLSMAFAQNWDNAKKHLFRGLVDKYYSNYDEELASQCMDLKEEEDKDVAVFKLIYVLNPNAPLCFRGVLYNDMEALGNAMVNSLPGKDPNIVQMISSGCLWEYVRNNPFDVELLNVIDGVTKDMKMNEDSDEYYKLMFILNPSRGIDINGLRCEDMQDLIEYLESVDDGMREQTAGSLIHDKIFIAWVKSLGYEKQVAEWKEIYKGVDW